MASKRRAQQQNPPRLPEVGVVTPTFDTGTFVVENINPLFDPGSLPMILSKNMPFVFHTVCT
jgi:hypothetical protein